MLTISKPLSAGQAQTYHQAEFTAKEQNYWSQRGVIAGEWQGGLAERFDSLRAESYRASESAARIGRMAEIWTTLGGNPATAVRVAGTA